jgi:hypothetical protein
MKHTFNFIIFAVVLQFGDLFADRNYALTLPLQYFYGIGLSVHSIMVLFVRTLVGMFAIV